MSSSKAARFRETEADEGRCNVEPSATASLHMATLVGIGDNDEALLRVDEQEASALFLQSVRDELELRGLKLPCLVLIGRVAGVNSKYVVLGLVPHESPAREPGKIILEAQSGVELRCGRSVITLNPDGNITIKGVNVTNRASRACKIRGATVNIN